MVILLRYISLDNGSIFYRKNKSYPLPILFFLYRSHYPERLANGFHVNPNFLVWVPLKIINPFLDPVTRSKTQIVYSKNSNKKKAEQDGVIAGMGNGVIDLAEHVDVDVLERCCGGGFEFEFDSDVYLGELFGETME